MFCGKKKKKKKKGRKKKKGKKERNNNLVDLNLSFLFPQSSTLWATKARLTTAPQQRTQPLPKKVQLKYNWE